MKQEFVITMLADLQVITEFLQLVLEHNISKVGEHQISKADCVQIKTLDYEVNI